ncbi:Amino-oxidase domain-containing protein [Aphelenchoides bicaudatus]|nr:Amino-oxidase domain-containing protein [Aphelenchoides bicaudatus]
MIPLRRYTQQIEIHRCACCGHNGDPIYLTNGKQLRFQETGKLSPFKLAISILVFLHLLVQTPLKCKFNSVNRVLIALNWRAKKDDWKCVVRSEDDLYLICLLTFLTIPTNMRADLVILGAGPTGLGALQRFFELQSQNYIQKYTKVLIIDREPEAGGLSRTVTDQYGFKWDMGVHVIGASRFNAFLKMIEETIPDWNADITGIGDDKCEEVKYAPYPVQNSIHYFPLTTRDKCLAELERRKPSRSNDTLNFGHFSEQHFGKTLQEAFIRPYNEKIWTVPIEEMNSTWVEGRVPKIDLNLLRKRCKSPLSEIENDQEETPFRYPTNSGIGDLWKAFADKFPQKIFLYNTEVVNVDTREKTLFLRDRKTGEEREIFYELMVSTIPLIELNKLTGLFSSLKLRHSNVILVGIGLHTPQNDLASKLSWAYYPRQSIIFYRCTVLSNFSNNLTPDPQKFWSVLCEIGKRPDDEQEPNDSLVKRVIKDLIDVKIVDSEKQIYSTYVCTIPYGYPIPTLDRDQQLRKYNEAFESRQIFSRGRFGGWKYEVSNTDYCFEIGRQVVEKLYLDIDERLC